MLNLGKLNGFPKHIREWERNHTGIPVAKRNFMEIMVSGSVICYKLDLAVPETMRINVHEEFHVSWLKNCYAASAKLLLMSNNFADAIIQLIQ